MNDNNLVHGRYELRCIGSDGIVKWEDGFDNLVTDEGANFLLTQAFNTAINSIYFMGLISSVTFSAIIAGNTAAQIKSQSSAAGTNGWFEAGGATYLPTWSSPATNIRQTVAWAAAGSRTRALSATANFTMSAAGTVQGCFIVTGSGAVSTNGSLAGTLYSAGAFGSPKVVSNLDVLQVTYSTSV